MTTWLPCGLMQGLLLMAPAVGVCAAEAPVRVLILDGYSNHDWRLTTALIRGILEPTGLFKVDVSTAPADEGRAGLGHLAAAVLRATTSSFRPATTSEVARPGRARCGRTSRRSCAAVAASMSGMAATTPLPTGPPTTR